MPGIIILISIFVFSRTTSLCSSNHVATVSYGDKRPRATPSGFENASVITFSLVRAALRISGVDIATLSQDAIKAATIAGFLDGKQFSSVFQLIFVDCFAHTTPCVVGWR